MEPVHRQGFPLVTNGWSSHCHWKLQWKLLLMGGQVQALGCRQRSPRYVTELPPLPSTDSRRIWAWALACKAGAHASVQPMLQCEGVETRVRGLRCMLMLKCEEPAGVGGGTQGGVARQGAQQSCLCHLSPAEA